MGKNNSKGRAKTVELVNSAYQPTKAEQEEEVRGERLHRGDCRRCVEPGQRSMDK